MDKNKSIDATSKKSDLEETDPEDLLRLAIENIQNLSRVLNESFNALCHLEKLAENITDALFYCEEAATAITETATKYNVMLGRNGHGQKQSD